MRLARIRRIPPPPPEPLRCALGCTQASTGMLYVFTRDDDPSRRVALCSTHLTPLIDDVTRRASAPTSPWRARADAEAVEV